MPHHEEHQEEFHHESPKAASPVHHEPSGMSNLVNWNLSRLSDDHHSLKSHESFDQHISVVVEKIEKDSSNASGSPLGPDHVNVSDEAEHEVSWGKESIDECDSRSTMLQFPNQKQKWARESGTKMEPTSSRRPSTLNIRMSRDTSITFIRPRLM